MTEFFEADVIELPWPQRFWLAKRSDMSWLSDPDVDDATTRHDDASDISWDALAAVLTEVSAALADGSYTRSKGVSDTVEVLLESKTARRLTLAEFDVLDSWWTKAEAQRADPWSEALVNGRHRLWNVWKNDPEAVVPIRSDLFDYVDDIPAMGSAFAQTIRDTAKRELPRIPRSIAARSPLYIGELRRHGAPLYRIRAFGNRMLRSK